MATITGTEGDDTIRGGVAADILIGGGGDDWIEGGDEVGRGDQIEGGPGDDTLFGGAGDDVIGDWAGNDIMRGGPGDDDMYVQALEGSVFVRLGGGGGNDLIDVNMSGRDGPQVIEALGGRGDDVMSVYAARVDGSESLLATGGAGQDTYLFRFSGCAGGLTVTDFQTGAGGDRIDVDSLLHSPVSQGNRYDGGNPFDAERGCLRLVQDGANTLLQYDLDGVAGATHDWYTTAVLLGVDVGALTAHNFVGIPPDGSPIAGEELIGPDYSSQLEGWLGDDTLQGGSGNDVLRGAPGADLLVGGGGDDALIGSLGDDTLHGGTGNDQLIAQRGANRVHGGAGDDDLRCVGQCNDTVMGGAGADHILLSLNSGKQGASARVLGGDGNDIVRVGLDSGSSALATGGTGRDTYSLADRTLTGALSIRLTVTDFEAGTGGDCIRLSSIDADTATEENDAFIFIGTGTFSTTDATGQVRYAYDSLTGVGTLYGSTDADAQAEFAIALTGVVDLVPANLIL